MQTINISNEGNIGGLRKAGITYVLCCKTFFLVGMKNALNKEELGSAKSAGKLLNFCESFMKIVCMCEYVCVSYAQ